MNRLLAVLLLILPGMASVAQSESELQKDYPFLLADSNHIENLHALDPFFARLNELTEGKRRQVRILHIGDSHLQADFFSGENRRLLQLVFGNAGRGFVFPYKAAGTNGPVDYESGSYGAWESKRAVFPDKPLPIGLGGITLASTDSNAMVYLRLKTDYQEEFAFDKVTLFRQPGLAQYDLALGVDIPVMSTRQNAESYRWHTVRSGESLGIIARNYRTTIYQIKQWNNLRSDMIRAGQKLIVGVVYSQKPDESVGYNDLYCIPAGQGPVEVSCLLPSPASSLYLRHQAHGAGQSGGMLFGFSLENTRNSGVLYHTIGVNGAQYSHYCMAQYFAEQVSLLKPDLIIFSLGTNESFASLLGETELYGWIDSLVSTLSRLNPEAALLLCSQPDSYTRRRYKNPRNLMVRATIESYANNRYTAFWDLNEVMGGYGSVNRWYLAGLTARDKVHFTAGGYRIQGQLLFNALMNGYEQYRNAQH